MTQLSRLTENLPGSLYQYQINPDGSSFFPFTTRGISEIYEYSYEEIQADASKVFERIHPDDLEKVKASIEESALSTQDWHIEYRVCLPYKGLRWIRGQAKPQYLKNGAILWHGYLNDITQEKKQTNDLKHYQSQYRIAMEATQIGVWGWDIVTNEITWSDEAYTLLGYEPQQFLTTLKYVQETIMHPEDLDNFKRVILNNLTKHERFQIHFRLKSATGEWLWIESRARTTQFDAQGKPIYMIGTHTDITKIKHTEDDLTKARQIAERVTKEKSDLLSTVSHEIRTPLAGIIGLIELNLEENSPNELKKILHKIHHSSEQLLQILNDTLDYSKIEAGHLQHRTSTFNLEEMLQDVVSLFKPNAFSKNLILEVQLDSLPKFVENDELRLRQILSNLISNAIKFTQQGKITISVHTKIVDENNTQLEFLVSDTGIGIAPEIQPQLFTAYSQANTHTAHYYGGTGLGLMISERLVKLLGGKGIQVFSKLGEGACFSFILPFQQVAACEATLQPIATTHQCTKIMRGHLLVADDIAINREIVQQMLVSLGFKVTTADNGQQAVDLALSEDFNLVLIDLNMPIMDGFSATQRIKQHKPQLPIIALTASSIDLIQEKFDAAGLDDYLTKPLKKQELCQKLTQWLPMATIKEPSHCNLLTTLSIQPLKQSSVKPPEAFSAQDFNFEQGLTLFANNKITYLRLLEDFSNELNQRYRLVGEKIGHLMTNPLQKEDWIALHPETHTLKGTSGNLGLMGIADAATQLDDQLRQGLQPNISLLNNYQQQLDLTQAAIKAFIMAQNNLDSGNNNSQDKKVEMVATDYLAALNSLRNAIKANEFIDDITLKKITQQTPAHLTEQWEIISDALAQLNFSQAELPLNKLTMQIESSIKLC